VKADIDVYNADCQFACSSRQALSPPAIRRHITAGQTVNLDGIVLGVNAPPVEVNTDGGTSSQSCLPRSGGAATK
jgi:hypothetical protein